MFAHLPYVGYNEVKAYDVDNPLTTRWKALRDSRYALSVRLRFDDL